MIYINKDEMNENLLMLASDIEHEANLIKSNEVVYNSLKELMDYVETMIENNFDISVSLEIEED